MAKIGLVRLDDRLIHGQVITKWVNHSKSNRIIIVDDELVKNTFLTSVFVMAAPRGITVETKSTDQVAKEWIENELGSGTVLILFKYVKTLKAAYEKGLKINSVQVAGLGAGPGKKVVFKTVSLSNDDAKTLKELNSKNIDVVFQSIPEEKSVDLQTVLKKFFKDIA